jgi:glucose/arabinose dehydrogenase
VAILLLLSGGVAATSVPGLAAAGGLAGAPRAGAAGAVSARSPAPAPAGTLPDARASAHGVRLRRVGRFAAPVYVTAPPGDRRRLFVVERAGRIRVVSRGRKLSRPFLDIRRLVSTEGERGLLSMAFAPDYARTRRFYVYLTSPRGDIRIYAYRRSRGSRHRANSRTRRRVMSLRHRRFTNHNGGQLQFGPDGMLYLGTGDGGGSGDPFRSGQRLDTRLGKLLRIDPRPSGRRAYRVPADNPFSGRPGARPEIYAYGLRNPFRFSFDRLTGDLTIGDVGEQEVEEVDFLPRGRSGANFGWRCFEGRRRFAGCAAPGHVEPVLERFHSQGDCSITGGYVVRDPSLRSLYGRYVYGDYCTGRLRSASLRTGGADDDRPLGLTVGELSSFGEDASGRVYATSLRGRVYRLAPH